MLVQNTQAAETLSDLTAFPKAGRAKIFLHLSSWTVEDVAIAQPYLAAWTC